jgi:hypothetical protein
MSEGTCRDVEDVEDMVHSMVLGEPGDADVVGGNFDRLEHL